MTIEELGVRLKELETTCSTVSDELDAIRQRAERLEGLEQDRDALMEFYAGALPEELERLKPEERHRVYGMLRLEVSTRPDRTLEARGILGENLLVGSENGRAVCDPELALSCIAGWRMQRNSLDYRPPSPRGPPP
jgi:DNA repair exonuclease SbcCD nuclease subunit